MSEDDEFPPPKVTDAPAAIWLVYGELEHDDTHRECCAGGEVTWCEDRQFDSDVQYVRADLVMERVRVLREALEKADEVLEYMGCNQTSAACRAALEATQ